MQTPNTPAPTPYHTLLLNELLLNYVTHMCHLGNITNTASWPNTQTIELQSTFPRAFLIITLYSCVSSLKMSILLRKDPEEFQILPSDPNICLYSCHLTFFLLPAACHSCIEKVVSREGYILQIVLKASVTYMTLLICNYSEYSEALGDQTQ